MVADEDVETLVELARVAAEEVRESTRRRNEGIRRAVGSGVSARRVADATGMSVPQIRNIVAGRTRY